MCHLDGNDKRPFLALSVAHFGLFDSSRYALCGLRNSHIGSTINSLFDAHMELASEMLLSFSLTSHGQRIQRQRGTLGIKEITGNRTRPI